MKIEDGPKTVNIFKEIDANEDNQLSRDEVAEYLKVVMMLRGNSQRVASLRFLCRHGVNWLNI